MVVSFLKPLAHAEKEQLLKLHPWVHLGYDDNEAWVQSFFDNGYTVDVARHQLTVSFFEHGESDTIVSFLKHIQALKIKNIIYVLPPALHVTKKTSSVIQEKISDLIKLTSKYKAHVVIEAASQSYKHLMYVIKPFKPAQLSIVFDPVQIVKTGGSTLSQYRLYKKYIQYFVCHDISKDKVPTLMGYGQTQIIQLFKRLKKDNYKGSFICDPPFEHMLSTYQKHSKGLLKMFRKKELSQMEKLRSMMKISDDQKTLTLFDLYKHQYDVLRIIFRFR